MKKSILSLTVLALFAVGFAASDEETGSNTKSTSSTQQTEQIDDSETKEAPQKSIKDEIRELGYNDGVKFGYSDGGNTINYYIRMGSTRNEGLSHIQNVIAKSAYKEDYGYDISDELLDEYAEQFIEGYKSVVLK